MMEVLEEKDGELLDISSRKTVIEGHDRLIDLDMQCEVVAPAAATQETTITVQFTKPSFSKGECGTYQCLGQSNKSSASPGCDVSVVNSEDRSSSRWEECGRSVVPVNANVSVDEDGSLTPTSNSQSCSQTPDLVETYVVGENLPTNSLDGEHNLFQNDVNNLYPCGVFKNYSAEKNCSKKTVELAVDSPHEDLVKCAKDTFSLTEHGQVNNIGKQIVNDVKDKPAIHQSGTAEKKRGSSSKGLKGNGCEERGFDCAFCGARFDSARDRRIHSRSHKTERRHKCSVCEYTFARPYDLKKHLLVHSEEKPHVCDECGARFKRKSSLISHSARHSKPKPHKCSLCDERFTSKVARHKHKMTHKLTRDPKPHVCAECGAKFKIKSLLRKHSVTHTEEKLYQCDICQERFYTRRKMNIHRFSHGVIDKEEKPHVCGECGAKFRSKSELGMHSAIHTGEKRFKCNICSERFYSRTARDKHYFSHSSVTEEEKPHVCGECGAKFRGKRDLRVHSAIHTGEKLYKCDICHERFYSTKARRNHRLLHTVVKPYMCTLCNEQFDTEADLDRHAQIHANQKPPNFSLVKVDLSQRSNSKLDKILKAHKRFKCDLCDATFSSKYLLIDHGFSHTGEKPYSCSICPARFRAREGMLRHVRKHKTEGAHKCDLCEAKFYSGWELRVHVASHTGEKHYSCQFCDFRAYRMSELRKHSVTHAEVKPFICDICGQMFSRNDSLKVHLLLHAGKKAYKCDFCEAKFTTERGQRRHSATHKKGKVCKTSTKALESTRIHIGEKLYKCDFCEAKFTTERSKRRHSVRHKEGKVCKTSTKVLELPEEEKSISCREGGIKFSQCDSMEEHTCSGEKTAVQHKAEQSCTLIQTDLLEKDSYFSTVVRPYKCTLRDQSFRSRSVKYKHSLIHADCKHFNSRKLMARSDETSCGPERVVTQSTDNSEHTDPNTGNSKSEFEQNTSVQREISSFLEVDRHKMNQTRISSRHNSEQETENPCQNVAQVTVCDVSNDVKITKIIQDQDISLQSSKDTNRMTQTNKLEGKEQTPRGSIPQDVLLQSSGDTNRITQTNELEGKELTPGESIRQDVLRQSSGDTNRITQTNELEGKRQTPKGSILQDISLQSSVDRGGLPQIREFDPKKQTIRGSICQQYDLKDVVTLPTYCDQGGRSSAVKEGNVKVIQLFGQLPDGQSCDVENGGQEIHGSTEVGNVVCGQMSNGQPYSFVKEEKESNVSSSCDEVGNVMCDKTLYGQQCSVVLKQEKEPYVSSDSVEIGNIVCEQMRNRQECSIVKQEKEPYEIEKVDNIVCDQLSDGQQCSVVKAEKESSVNVEVDNSVCDQSFYGQQSAMQRCSGEERVCVSSVREEVGNVIMCDKTLFGQQCSVAVKQEKESNETEEVDNVVCDQMSNGQQCSTMELPNNDLSE